MNLVNTMSDKIQIDNGQLDKFWEERVYEHLGLICLLIGDNSFFEQIIKVSKVIVTSIKKGGKILICGNGGSAADAQHFAAELVNKFMMERDPLPAIALTTDTSIITSIGNDSGFDNIFGKQIEALCKKDDIVIVITTSDITDNKGGHSANIYNGIMAAKKKGAKTIGLISERGKKISSLVDLSLCVPSTSTPRIQEAQMLIYHMICEFLEAEIFGKLKERSKK